MKRSFCIGLAFVVLVAWAAAQETVWTVPGDFPTIQAAIDSPQVMPGSTILVKPGNFAGAFVTKPVEIRGEGNPIIMSGPAHGSGKIMGFRFMAGSDGASINHLVFEVDLAIMNGAAVNDVTIDHCTFRNAVQAVSNWRGDGWAISHNEIIDLRCDNGGGIGILVADYTGGTVENNIIPHNKIYGTLHVPPADGGGYAGSGIVLYADFRWGYAGAVAIKSNRVVKNTVSVTSDIPTLVDIWAIELTDTRDIPGLDHLVVFDNAIGFNDFRGSPNQIALTPFDLGDYNSISRNLGENRGHGLHPKVFLYD